MVDWPPHYADPIVFRLRFVPHPRPQPVVPAHLTSREGTFHAPTEAEAVEMLRRAGALVLDTKPAQKNSIRTIDDVHRPTVTALGDGSDMTAIPLVDAKGQAVLNYVGRPVLRPLRLPPNFFVEQGLMDREIVAGLNAAGHPEEAPAYILARLARFRQYGSWDAQRSSAGSAAPDFTDYATIAIGLYAAALGMSEPDILSLQDTYASLKSDFSHAQMSRDYPHLAERNVDNTKLGYRLYNEKISKSSGAP